MKKTWMLICVCAFLSVGCEKDYRDHEPPEGMGSLVVDNRTSRRIDIFIQGYKTNSVSSFSYRTMDMNPGEYRVVLDERNGEKYYKNDVDVLEDRLTIMEVFDGTSTYTFNVRVSFRKP